MIYLRAEYLLLYNFLNIPQSYFFLSIEGFSIKSSLDKTLVHVYCFSNNHAINLKGKLFAGNIPQNRDN